MKTYSIVTRPALIYGAETWTLKRKKELLIVRTEMRMMSWVMNISPRERKTNATRSGSWGNGRKFERCRAGCAGMATSREERKTNKRTKEQCKEIHTGRGWRGKMWKTRASDNNPYTPGWPCDGPWRQKLGQRYLSQRWYEAELYQLLLWRKLIEIILTAMTYTRCKPLGIRLWSEKRWDKIRRNGHEEKSVVVSSVIIILRGVSASTIDKGS